tara:strand:- start:3362 stop:4492 length:1131 start_codon:yes stop_codon:yes gene_type:complete
MIEKYVEEENKFRALITNYLRGSFKPSVFQMDNYPIILQKFEELEAYIDEMKHNKEYIFFLSADENFKKKFKLICKIVSEISFENFKKKIVPISSLLIDIKYAQICNQFLKNSSNPRIFEIGPGSGYFGVATALDNINYSSTDTTMGFFLWQAILYQKIDTKFKVDFKTNDFELFNKDSLISHNTWWKIAELYHHIDKTNNNFCDIIYCSSAFAEFSSLSQNYYIKIGKKLLSKNFDKNNRIGFFYMPNFGKFNDPQLKNSDIINKFEKEGFLALSLKSGFVFILKETIKDSSKIPTLDFINTSKNFRYKNFILKNYLKKFSLSKELKTLIFSLDQKVFQHEKNKEIEKIILEAKKIYEFSNNYKVNEFIDIPIKL